MLCKSVLDATLFDRVRVYEDCHWLASGDEKGSRHGRNVRPPARRDKHYFFPKIWGQDGSNDGGVRHPLHDHACFFTHSNSTETDVEVGDSEIDAGTELPLAKLHDLLLLQTVFDFIAGPKKNSLWQREMRKLNGRVGESLAGK